MSGPGEERVPPPPPPRSQHPPPPGGAAGQPPPPPCGGGRYGGGSSAPAAGAGTKGACNDFMRGTCTRGDQCRYSHIGGPSDGSRGGGGSHDRTSSYGRPSAPKEPSDDWQCDGCGNSNFQWRKACKRCNAPKSKAVKDAEQKAAAGWLHAGLTNTSNRIFVKGFDPKTTTENDLKELFSGIGIIARVRQKFGFPDQWPHAVKIYKDADGKNKDEAVIKYDDPMAAQSAPGFYDGYDMKGSKLSVSIATSREDREGGGGGGGGADRGGYNDRGGGGYNDRGGGYSNDRGGGGGYRGDRGGGRGYGRPSGGRGYDDRRGGDRHRPY